MVFGRGKKKEEEQREEDFGRTVVLQDQTFDENYMHSLGRSVYMIMDPNVLDQLLNDNQLKHLLPAFTHLNRVTNIGHGKEGRKEAARLMLDFEFIILIHKLNMNEDTYDNEGWAKLEALKIFARQMVNDCVDGWKGRLLTEQIKIVRAEVQTEKKKKGWF